LYPGEIEEKLKALITNLGGLKGNTISGMYRYVLSGEKNIYTIEFSPMMLNSPYMIIRAESALSQRRNWSSRIWRLTIRSRGWVAPRLLKTVRWLQESI